MQSIFRHAAAAACIAAFLQPARADVLPPILSHDIGAYALYGRSYVAWDGAATMPARGSVGSESSVAFSAFTAADGEDSFVAAATVQATAGTRIHAVFSSSLATSADVVIEHPPMPLALPVVSSIDFPQAPAFDCGGADITVDSTNSPLSLPPGRYGNITVMQDQTLRLQAGGRYEACNMRVRPGATVEAHSGTFVLLRDYLLTGARAHISGDDACGARWIALATTPSPAPSAAGFEFDQGTGSQNRALIQGQFFTPGRITMAQPNDYVGRFWADRIDGLGGTQVTRTLADCTASRCGDGVLDPGEQCDDGNNRDGDCCSAFCQLVAAGSSCDDGKFCTMTDTCDGSGHCSGSRDPCVPPDGDANCSESCNEVTHACDAPDPDGSSCDDGLWCNGSDRCAGGQCIAHSGSPCPGPDQDFSCHESCDEADHACDAPDPVGAPCNDGLFCTVGETCNASGACIGGSSPCPGADGDGNCAETCDELGRSCTASDPEGSPCDDGLFCTATDTCDGRGTCRGWGDPCAADVGDGDSDCSESCSEADRACSAPDIDGAPCDDGLACTIGERCIGGACTASGTTSCDDGNPCTDEFCAPDGSCLRSYNSNACNDGNPCTTGDRCLGGTCTGSGTIDCSDDDLCTSDVCDPIDGSCHHSYAPATDCHVAGTSTTEFELGYSPKDGQLAELLETAWRGARDVDATAREELGDPSQGDAFSVCFYDEAGGVPSLAYRLDLEPSTVDASKWSRTWRESGLVYRMKATDGTSQGVSQMRIGVDKHGAPAFKLKAGANNGCTSDCRAKFQPPAGTGDGRLFSMEPGMTVQWVASTGACWSARYDAASVNTSQSFHARSRPH
ncbi:MAG TPA: hypothetical protein VGK20_11145 [Candidatus Binatia bacterium]|jgi:hypothetical protein